MANNMMSFLMNMMRSGGNPEQMALQLLQQQDSPFSKNLLNLAQQGDSEGMEKIARNICAQRGVDFDSEFKAFKEQFGFR